MLSWVTRCASVLDSRGQGSGLELLVSAGFAHGWRQIQRLALPCGRVLLHERNQGLGIVRAAVRHWAGFPAIINPHERRNLLHSKVGRVIVGGDVHLRHNHILSLLELIRNLCPDRCNFRTLRAQRAVEQNESVFFVCVDDTLQRVASKHSHVAITSRRVCHRTNEGSQVTVVEIHAQLVHCGVAEFFTKDELAPIKVVQDDNNVSFEMIRVQLVGKVLLLGHCKAHERIAVGKLQESFAHFLEAIRIGLEVQIRVSHQKGQHVQPEPLLVGGSQSCDQARDDGKQQGSDIDDAQSPFRRVEFGQLALAFFNVVAIVLRLNDENIVFELFAAEVLDVSEGEAILVHEGDSCVLEHAAQFGLAVLQVGDDRPLFGVRETQKIRFRLELHGSGACVVRHGLHDAVGIHRARVVLKKATAMEQQECWGSHKAVSACQRSLRFDVHLGKDDRSPRGLQTCRGLLKLNVESSAHVATL
eukprot:m.715196 g.715196  ORF g.715196 m.715196 type:complete len:473 (+) comp58786_c0_seq4:3626-5044(+)